MSGIADLLPTLQWTIYNLCPFDDKKITLDQDSSFRILAPWGNVSDYFERKCDRGKLRCFETSFPCSGNNTSPVGHFLEIDSCCQICVPLVVADRS